MSRGLRPPATSFFHLASVSRDSKRSRSEEHTSELQSPDHLVCRLLLEKKKKSLDSHTSPPCAPPSQAHAHHLLHADREQNVRIPDPQTRQTSYHSASGVTYERLRSCHS